MPLKTVKRLKRFITSRFTGRGKTARHAGDHPVKSIRIINMAGRGINPLTVKDIDKRNWGQVLQ